MPGGAGSITTCSGRSGHWIAVRVSAGMKPGSCGALNLPVTSQNPLCESASSGGIGAMTPRLYSDGRVMPGHCGTSKSGA